MLFDTHVHVVATDPARYPFGAPPDRLPSWAKDRAHTGESLLAAMDGAGSDYAALTQPVGVYGYDNAYLCDLAATHPDRFIAIPAVDPFDADSPHLLGELGRQPAVRGLRLFVPGGGPEGWPDLPGLYPLVEAAAELELVVALQLRPGQLTATAALAARYPRASLVVDQLAGIIPSDPLVPDLLALAEYCNIYVKLTTQNLDAPDDPEPGRLLADVLQAFRPQRVLWGSNYPAAPGSDAGYSPLVDQARQALAHLPADTQSALRGETAARLYRLA